MIDNLIPLDDANIFFNSTTHEIAVGVQGSIESANSKKYPFWIRRMDRITAEHLFGIKYTKGTKNQIIADLLGLILYECEQGNMDLHSALKEIRKIEGVSKYIDRKQFWN